MNRFTIKADDRRSRVTTKFISCAMVVYEQISVGLQSMRAALAHPTDSLRRE